MIAHLTLLTSVLVSLLKSRGRLEAEVVLLRHQLNVLRRAAPPRFRFTSMDRLIFVWLYRLCPSLLNAVSIIKPATVLRWHRRGFRLYWRWKSRSPGGRPKISRETRQLIRVISLANPLWGAPRIHGELLKLGIEVGETTVAKYMVKGGRPSSQTWRTFLRNHAAGIAAIDFLIAPTIGFRPLYALVILRHDRRQIVSIGVTSHPTAPWIARQIGDAFPWDEEPRYLIRDRDAAYVMPCGGGCRPWAFAIVPPRLDRPGKTLMRSGWSVPSAGNASIILSCSAKLTFAVSSKPMPATTTARGLICR